MIPFDDKIPIRDIKVLVYKTREAKKTRSIKGKYKYNAAIKACGK
jgi:hypothetical protein